MIDYYLCASNFLRTVRFNWFDFVDYYYKLPKHTNTLKD